MFTPDLPAIKARFDESGRKVKSWARVKGINPDTFQSFMIGRFLPQSGEVIDSIVANLKKDGLWVEAKAPRKKRSRISAVLDGTEHTGSAA